MAAVEASILSDRISTDVKSRFLQTSKGCVQSCVKNRWGASIHKRSFTRKDNIIVRWNLKRLWLEEMAKFLGISTHLHDSEEKICLELSSILWVWVWKDKKMWYIINEARKRGEGDYDEWQLVTYDDFWLRDFSTTHLDSIILNKGKRIRCNESQIYQKNNTSAYRKKHKTFYHWAKQASF